MSYFGCPKCGNRKGIATERRVGGDSICQKNKENPLGCGYVGNTNEFNSTPERPTDYPGVWKELGFNLSVHLTTQSEPINFLNVSNAYTKGGMYCVMYPENGKTRVDKFPLCNIFRVTERDGRDK